MNKETLIALIEKDIDELKTLTHGFSAMDMFPQPLIDLAVAKADNLHRYLSELPNVSAPNSVPDEPAPVEQPHNEPQPVQEQQPVSAIPTEEEIAPEPVEPIATKPTEPFTIVAEIISKTETVVDEFEKKDDASLAHAIASKPVTDLKQAISIADRFRFQRELFANNGETMMKALDALNACDNYEQAEELMHGKFALPSDSPDAADFVELVKRRFGR